MATVQVTVAISNEPVVVFKTGSTVTVALADIKRATVEIEFNRKDGDKE